MATFLLSTFGSYGNTAPFLRLGQELGARGHEVHLWTNFPLSRDAHPAAVRLHALGGSEAYAQFTADADLLARFESLPAAFRRHYLPAARREFSEMEALYERGKTILITSDAPGLAARLIAEKYGAPLVSIFTYPNQLVSASLIGTLVGGALRNEMADFRVTAGLGPDFDSETWWGQPHHYLALWPAWFAREQVATEAKVSFPSFLFYDAEPVVPDRLKAFLAGAAPTVLITGGSAGFSGAAFIQTATDLVRDCGVRAILVAPGEADAQKDIMRVDRVPSMPALMAKVSAIIHHGGMGTISQAIEAGLPQLVLADGADRPENGEIVEHLGLGRVLRRSDWRPARLRAALKDVLGSPLIRTTAAERARDLQDSTGLTNAISTIERMADRALLAESCVYAGSRAAGAERSDPARDLVSGKLAALSPERRYLLIQALRSKAR